MDEVYIVMVGCIGDRGIYDVCATEELAKETVEYILKYEKYGKSLDPDYEKWEVKSKKGGQHGI